ncbi:hypothetical protein X275_08255 [Marinitoga sp. 1197]|uniref:hypothetical protein n=1 Tax=Marinitoga sp. 1197 TaxID=1428449 RepID=UPI0006414D92|nr:hypothetical protein [Marinitoga sp. 1197]KLO21873.1 hypothetical protein X275_08255 [Marinitoga sp. 1197]
MDILGGIFNAAKGVVGFANNLLNGGSKPAPAPRPAPKPQPIVIKTEEKKKDNTMLFAILGLAGVLLIVLVMNK